MELSDWCEQVPHGQYFQPIRLRLDGAVGPMSNGSSHAASVSETSTPSAVQPLPGGDGPTSDASPAKHKKRKQKPAPVPPKQSRKTLSDVDNDGVVLLPPFQSAHLGEERMVLNVGGPVWAMDWMPHDVYRATTNATTRSKKKTVGTATESNKENVSRNVAAAATATPPLSSKDPLADWRLLALSTHPPCKVVNDRLVKNTPPDHYYDAPQSGRGLVQIWAIPVKKASTNNHSKDDDAAQSQRMTPRLVYAIDHDSGVAWDLHWSPLTHKMPRYRAAQSVLGVLAIAFGDGSLQIFEIPMIQAEKLHTVPNEHVVERLRPIASGVIDANLQLSVRWSPHRWNLLITGCSDGSVALWNVEELLSSRPDEEAAAATAELEPQRRFQDADTIGKQEPFDWGWGWVAIRAVSWSPLDENLFATTGNDSLFKLWDIREPRVCLRSHRIRSTWGLSMQWMDDTFIQISGDQGSIYTYDVLSGSYQKLHFHPQIDSPVWDLQYARRGSLPLLVSSCTSGSLRLAPAKKLFRAPQNSIEICRLQGEKDANVEQPHKSLTLSFEHRLVSGSAEVASPATREFCERDASLHRVRLSTIVPGSFPCFLATAGHAGLVIIMEMQQQLDDVFDKYFLQPNKKIGRPRKVTQDGTTSPWTNRLLGKEKTKKAAGAPPKAKRASGGNANLSSFVQGKAVAVPTAKSKKAVKKADEEDYRELEAEESESEPEYQEDEDEASESESESLSLGDDNSDDDRVVATDDDEESDEVEVVAPEDQNAVRMRQEYQLDLSEEDAMLLAIQMSEMEQSKPPRAANQAAAQSTGSTPAKLKSPPKSNVPAKSASKPLTKSKAKTPPSSSKKKAALGSTATTTTPAHARKRDQTAAPAASSPPLLPVGEAEAEAVAAAMPSVEPSSPMKKQARGSASKPSASKPPKVPVLKTPSPASLRLDELNQATIQMHIYQQGMTEEDALREAIRISEEGVMRRSHRKRKTPPSTEPTLVEHTPSKALKRTPVSRQNAQATDSTMASPEDVTRRLEFANGSPENTPPLKPVPATASPPMQLTRVSQPPKPHAKSPPAVKKTATSKTPVPVTTNTEASAPAAVEPSHASAMATPEKKTTGKWPSSTSSKGGRKSPTSSAKKPKTKRASGGRGDLVLSEEELIAIALQTSQIEY